MLSVRLIDWFTVRFFAPAAINSSVVLPIHRAKRSLMSVNIVSWVNMSVAVIGQNLIVVEENAEPLPSLPRANFFIKRVGSSVFRPIRVFCYTWTIRNGGEFRSDFGLHH